MTPTISVIVTTHNRSELLGNCLKGLCEQTLERSQYEVIVVDNASTDSTSQVVQTFEETGFVDYYFEGRLGMNHARNFGLQKARGRFVAYIDDDARAAPNWLEVAVRELSSIDPAPDCLGGPIFPFYTSPKPEWFEDKYEIRRDWETPRYLQPGNSFSGSNMIWQKKVLKALNGFDPDFGVTGNTLRLGGESIVFSKIWSAFDSPRLYFCPGLIVYHWVPAFKMTVAYRVRRSLATGQFLAKTARPETAWVIIRKIFSDLYLVLRRTYGAFLRIQKYRLWQRWVVEEFSRGMVPLGEVLGLVGIQLNLSQKPE